MLPPDDLHVVLVGEEIPGAGAKVVPPLASSSPSERSGAATAAADGADGKPGRQQRLHQLQIRRHGSDGDYIRVIPGARKTHPHRVDKTGRKSVDFLHAMDWGTAGATARKNEVVLRCKASTVVNGIRHDDAVLTGKINVNSQRGEVLPKGLLRAGGEHGCASPDLWSIRLWPKGHVREHARVQT